MEQQDNQERIATAQEVKTKSSKKNYSKYFSSTPKTSKSSRSMKVQKTSKSTLIITLVSCYIVVFLLCGMVVINIIQNKSLDEKYANLQDELSTVEQRNLASNEELEKSASRDLEEELNASNFTIGDAVIISSSQSEKILETEEKEQTNWFNEFYKAISKFLGVN
jgi:hypothetical protein